MQPHLNISTLLSPHGHWGTQLSPLAPPCHLLTQAPSGTRGEQLPKSFKTLRYLTGLFALLQGYLNLSGYWRTSCLNEGIYILGGGTHWQSSVWRVFYCGHYVSMYMNKILIWSITQDKYIQFSLLHQTQQYLATLWSQQSWEGWFSVLPQNEK